MPQDIKFPPLSNDYSHIETRLSRLISSYQKTVSVVIPHYNNLAVLEKTLASLTIQTYPLSLIEVVISDDGSDEDISSLVPIFQSYLPIKVLRNSRRGHRVATMRNYGILAARNEIILSIDCDIICPPNTIEEHLKWFHISDRVATIGPRRFVDTSELTAGDIMNDIDSVLRLPDIKSISNTNPNGLSDKRMLEFQFMKQHPFPCNCFHGGNVAYKREHAMNIGLWDESFNGNPNYEDIEFGHRLWKAGVYLVYSPEARVLHQENHVVSLEQKRIGGAINRQRLFSKVPGLQEFRASLPKEGSINDTLQKTASANRIERQSYESSACPPSFSQ